MLQHNHELLHLLEHAHHGVEVVNVVDGAVHGSVGVRIATNRFGSQKYMVDTNKV